MGNNNADEIHKIVEFTLKNTFDRMEFEHHWPKVESETPAYLLVTGTKGEKEFSFKSEYKDLFAMKANNTLNDYLLKKREEARLAVS